MPIEIKMPQLFASNDEGTIAKWLVKEGQQVAPGDVIAEIETDEAMVEIEAVEGGRIVKLLVAEGTRNVKVNAPIAMLEAAGGAVGRGSPAVAAATRIEQARAKPGDVAPAAPPPQPAPLIRTRLVGSHERSQLSPGAPGPSSPGPSSPSASSPGGSSPGPSTLGPASGGIGSVVMQLGSAKTEYIRAEQTQVDPVAGWIVVVKGPGRGGFRPVFVGMNSVGRDPTQRVCLNFGDEAISREEHAFITYDEEQRRYYIQHGGKANLVRLGKQPVLVPVELKANDLIRLGRTTLRFVPCCGADFSWGDEIQEG